MKETIDAIYENGLIRPLRKLSISEGRKIRVTLDTPDEGQAAEPVEGEPSKLNLENLVGSLKDSPRFGADPVTLQKTLRDEWR